MLGRMEDKGIKRSKIILDPGIGFGKSAEQSFAILKNIDRLQSLGVQVLVGHSRKSFLSLFTDKPSGERDPETLAVSCFLAARGVDYLRVHDVKSHAAMLRMKAVL
jgi:2-amino-4-hydroxy-6-hydroxymethyldihydropteridine diphosphokinase/dihydropteroate synthase